MKNSFQSVFLSYVLVLISLSQVSCDKKIPDGSEVKLEGIATERLTNIPIKNAQILIAASKYLNTAGGRRLALDLIFDSLLTDENGKFERSFKTFGNYDGYEFVVRFPENYDDNFQYNWEKLDVGTVNSFHFEARKMKVLNLELKIVDNPFPPLEINPYKYSYKAFGDTTLNLFVLPEFGNRVTFRINDKNYPDVYKTFDTSFLITEIQDTFYQKITVIPSTFK